MSVRYHQAVAASRKREQNTQRLGDQIYQAQRDYNLGRAFSFQVRRGALQIVDPKANEIFDATKLRLVESFESGESQKKLEKLLRTRSVPSDPYVGAAAEISKSVKLRNLSKTLR